MVYATWNVRSLYRPGALAKLKEELNKYKLGELHYKKLGGVGVRSSTQETS